MVKKHVTAVQKSPAKRASKRKLVVPEAEALMSQRELAILGGGRLAYIKVMTSDEAKRIYPAIDDMPSDVLLYALNAADGTPIALTDTLKAAVGHAIGDELEIAPLH